MSKLIFAIPRGLKALNLSCKLIWLQSGFKFVAFYWLCWVCDNYFLLASRRLPEIFTSTDSEGWMSILDAWKCWSQLLGLLIDSLAWLVLEGSCNFSALKISRVVFRLLIPRLMVEFKGKPLLWTRDSGTRGSVGWPRVLCGMLIPSVKSVFMVSK